MQGERKFPEAADVFAQVKGPPAFEVRAAAAELQCLADTLTNAPKDADKAWADPLRARAARAHDRFQRVAANAKSGATPELRARVTLSKAMSESAGPSPPLAQSLETLKDFEKRYPGATDLHLLAGALRLLLPLLPWLHPPSVLLVSPAFLQLGLLHALAASSLNFCLVG